MHALIKDGQVIKYPYGASDLRRDHPNVSFPKVIKDDVFSTFGVERVFFSAQPEITNEQRLQEGTPVFEDRWTQTWQVIDLSPEEIAQRLKDMVPAEVTMRQARLALFAQGIMSQVDAALVAIPDETERTKAQIEWEYATVVERNAQLTLALGAAMGLTEDQLDQLFIFAGTL
jgi:hypothetical protein